MTHPNRGRRRWLSIAAISTVGALALAGCGGSTPDDTASAAEPATNFSFSFPQANDTENFYQQFAQEYEKEAGVTIELLPIPGENYQSQLNTQLQAGNAADLFVAPPGSGQVHSVVNLAEAGLVATVPSASSVIPKGTEALDSYEGQAYGQPTALSANSLIWSSAAATTAGVTVPATFEDLLRDCSVARDKGVDYTVIAGAVPDNLGFLASTISATRVYAKVPDWNAKRSAGEVNFANSPEWRQVLTDFVAMKDAGCFQKGAEGGGFDAISGGVISGTGLSVSIPGAATVGLGAASGGKTTLDVQAFPPAAGGSGYLIASPIYAWAANAKSEPGQLAAVQKFRDWAAQPENITKFADLSGSVPVTFTADTSVLPQYEAIKPLLVEGAFAPEPNLSWPDAAVYQALGSGMQGLLTGQNSVDDVLAAMDTAWG